MEAVETALSPFTGPSSNLSLRRKTSVVWNEAILNALQSQLNCQVQTMMCLLQVINLKLPEKRRDLLRESEPILTRSDESAYSIVPSRPSSRTSLSTTQSADSADGTSLRYQHLACEDQLFTARVYRRNYRTALFGQLYKARRAVNAKGALSTNQRNAIHNLIRGPNVNAQLLEAARTQDRQMTLSLRGAGADINCSDDYGLRPLHLVSLRCDGQENIVELLQCGADINAKNTEGMTPLVYACSQSLSLKMPRNIQLLLAHGANFGISDKSGEGAVQKLEKLLLPPPPSGPLGHSRRNVARRARYIPQDLRDLQYDGVLALDSTQHSLLRQRTPSVGDLKPYEGPSPRDPQSRYLSRSCLVLRGIEAAWKLGGPRYLSSLKFFIDESFQSMKFPSETIKTRDTEVVMDLVFEAQRLQQTHIALDFDQSMQVGVHYSCTNIPLLYYVLNVLVWTVYQFLRIHKLKMRCQPLREALRDANQDFHSTCGKVCETDCADWAFNIENALPKDAPSRYPIRRQEIV